MERSFQTLTLAKKLIEKLNNELDERGTKTSTFLLSKDAFNKLSERQKIDMIAEIMDSQTGFIKQQMAKRKDIGIEGLGRFLFASTRQRFYEEVNKELELINATSLRSIGKDEKQRIVEKAGNIVSEETLKKYFERINLRDNPPKPLGVLIYRSNKQ